MINLPFMYNYQYSRKRNTLQNMFILSFNILVYLIVMSFFSITAYATLIGAYSV